jgi:PII-like signaling protein
MERREVVLVRVYLTERRAKVTALLRRLATSGKVRGVTVFEGMAGLGTTAVGEQSLTSVEGKPIVLEFLEDAKHAGEVVELLRTLVAPRHVVMMPVTLLETADVPVSLRGDLSGALAQP